MFKQIECIIPRINPKVNYGLWVIMTYQCRFISCDKCTKLVSDTDNEGGYANVAFLLNFAVNLKSALKKT